MKTEKAAQKNSTSVSSTTKSKLRVGIVVPHIFMHRDILPQVIFSPGHLAIELANGLSSNNIDVTLYTPGPIETLAKNVTADLSYFDRELAGRGDHGDSYMDLLRKHPFTFITLARQVQSEIVSRAYQDANDDKLDVVHVYTNEEELALPFAKLCKKPVVFTHHDPFNFLVKYKNNFPKYRHLNWISLSYAQRAGMPEDTNWVANIYHGLDQPEFRPLENPSKSYVAYLGRIIKPKGVHLAIKAVQEHNETATTPLILRIAGKHYSDESKDNYWREHILPQLDDTNIVYEGFIDNPDTLRGFLGNAKALLVPSLFEEPFGMVTLEAFACGTPVIALDSGALPEVIENGKTGIIINKLLNQDGKVDEAGTIAHLANALSSVEKLDRTACVVAYNTRFTRQAMVMAHAQTYEKLANTNSTS
jgi:glycosyltransferase involved in cell wall biosynthesis